MFNIFNSMQPSPVDAASIVRGSGARGPQPGNVPALRGIKHAGAISFLAKVTRWWKDVLFAAKLHRWWWRWKC